MVDATFVLTKAPVKLRPAAMIMAVLKDKTLVETEVAMAFAVSCIPFI
jgi:hypothetical protein